MTSLGITWTLLSHGWASVKVSDDHDQGEESYESHWGQPFPRTELEALRTAMRAHQRAATPSP